MRRTEHHREEPEEEVAMAAQDAERLAARVDELAKAGGLHTYGTRLDCENDCEQDTVSLEKCAPAGRRGPQRERL